MSVIPDPAVTDWVPMGFGLGGPIPTQPSVEVRRAASNQSFSNSAWNSVSFDTAVYDRGPSAHWSASSPTRLTCQVAGTYTLSGSILYNTNTGGVHRLCSIWVNGVNIAEGGYTAVPGNGYARTTCTHSIYMNVGDYAELRGYQDSGAALDTIAWNTGTGSLCFSMVMAGGVPGPPGVGIPTPVVNNQWLKGSGGAVVYSGITEDTAWHTVGAAGEVPFQNSWANLGAPSGQPQARYRKLANGMVTMQGVITGGALNSIAFTLPAGWRPSYGNGAGSLQSWFVVQTSSATTWGNVLLRNDGAVLPNVGASWWFLDNISFYAEQ